MESVVDFKTYANIELEEGISPCDFCVLSNDRILLTNYKQRSLVLYDQNFKLIKKISNIESSHDDVVPCDASTNDKNETIGSVCVDTNDKRDALYISDYNNHKVFKCDLNFNQLSSTSGDADHKLKHPFGICFHNDSLYVCDCSNKRIQKLNASDLQSIAAYDLDYKPWRIKIGPNNLACVRATLTNPSINFYNLDSFQLLIQYKDRNGIIGFVNSKFYEYYGPMKKIYCYNASTGVVEAEIDTDGLGLGNITSRNGAIIQFNNQIIVGSHDSQKICIVKLSNFFRVVN